MDNPQIITIMTAIIAGVCGSGFMGFLQFLINRHDQKNSKLDENQEDMKNALKGILHSLIMENGKEYLEEQSMPLDDYNELNDYLYEPYVKLGGNGACKRLMEELEAKPKTRN